MKQIPIETLKNFNLKSFIKDNITLEPLCFLYALTYGIIGIVSSELVIQKVCLVNLDFGEEICKDIQEHKEKQVEVQKYVATLQIYNTVLQVGIEIYI